MFSHSFFSCIHYFSSLQTASTAWCWRRSLCLSGTRRTAPPHWRPSLAPATASQVGHDVLFFLRIYFFLLYFASLYFPLCRHRALCRGRGQGRLWRWRGRASGLWTGRSVVPGVCRMSDSDVGRTDSFQTDQNNFWILPSLTLLIGVCGWSDLVQSIARSWTCWLKIWVQGVPKKTVILI